jgi:hypothetical protein
MTFEDIATLAKKRGFVLSQREGIYHLYFKCSDGVVAETSLLTEEKSKLVNFNSPVSWEFVLKDAITQKELYHDWIEHYHAETADERMTNIKLEIWNFVDKISSLDFRIREYCVFSFFKWKFGKVKQLEFKTESGWRDLWDREPSAA